MIYDKNLTIAKSQLVKKMINVFHNKMIGIKELDLEILKKCKDIQKCSLVCKEWKTVMDTRKALFKTKLRDSLVAFYMDKSSIINNQQDRIYHVAALKAVIGCIADLQQEDADMLIGAKPASITAEHIRSVLDIDQANADIWSTGGIAGTKNLFEKCKKKQCDVLYMHYTAVMIVLVFETCIILCADNETITTYETRGANFIDYANGIIYFEFAGGIYQTIDFVSTKFIRWISED